MVLPSCRNHLNCMRNNPSSVAIGQHLLTVTTFEVTYSQLRIFYENKAFGDEWNNSPYLAT